MFKPLILYFCISTCTHGLSVCVLVSGKRGSPGLMGLPGNRGPDGYTGPSGPLGPKGCVGPAGPKGEKGRVSPCPTYAPAQKGPRGPAGPCGEVGHPGLQGENGRRGPKGEIQDAAQVTIIVKMVHINLAAYCGTRWKSKVQHSGQLRACQSPFCELNG